MLIDKDLRLSISGCFWLFYASKYHAFILSTNSFASFDISITFSTKYKKTSKHEKANKLYYRLILLGQIVAKI